MNQPFPPFATPITSLRDILDRATHRLNKASRHQPRMYSACFQKGKIDIDVDIAYAFIKPSQHLQHLYMQRAGYYMVIRLTVSHTHNNV